MVPSGRIKQALPLSSVGVRSSRGCPSCAGGTGAAPEAAGRGFGAALTPPGTGSNGCGQCPQSFTWSFTPTSPGRGKPRLPPRLSHRPGPAGRCRRWNAMANGAPSSFRITEQGRFTRKRSLLTPRTPRTSTTSVLGTNVSFHVEN